MEIQHLVDYKVVEADARKSKDLRMALNKSQLKDFNHSSMQKDSLESAAGS